MILPSIDDSPPDMQKYQAIFFRIYTYSPDRLGDRTCPQVFPIGFALALSIGITI